MIQEPRVAPPPDKEPAQVNLRYLWWWIRFYIVRIFLFLVIVAVAWIALKSGSAPQKQSGIEESPKIETPVTELDAYELAVKKLSQEQKDVLHEAGIGKGSLTVEIYSPAAQLNKEINKHRESVATFMDRLKGAGNYIISKKSLAKRLVIILFQISAVLLVVFRAVKLWEPLRILSSLLIETSKILLVAVSVIALIAAFGFKTNIWAMANFAPFWIPVGMLGMGMLGTWWVDDNFPIWKAFYKEMMFPLVSGVGIILKNLFF
ncbi:MAG: hypothetical protein ABII64_03165 [Elusimicrobiota bacterium]